MIKSHCILQWIVISTATLAPTTTGFQLNPTLSKSRRHHVNCPRVQKEEEGSMSDFSDYLPEYKTSACARWTKILNDKMAIPDWREQRARLVAMEKTGACWATEEYSEIKKTTDPKHTHDLGETFVRQFAEALSNMFPGSNPSKTKTTTTIEETEESEEIDKIVLAPDFIIDDPFITRGEVEAIFAHHYRDRRDHIDTHRWAHRLSRIEEGCLLLANERLGGVFHQTVLLVVEHDEQRGSAAIIINRPMGNLRDVFDTHNTTASISLRMAFGKAPVSYGGPVNPQHISVLHSYAPVHGSVKVSDGIYVGGENELIECVRYSDLQPHETLFVKGNAAWVGGQLNKEVAKGTWYPVAASKDLILRYAGAPLTKEDNPDDLWLDIMTCLGDDYAERAKEHAGRGDRRVMPRS